MITDFTYPHRNGETTPPELVPDDFGYYWFDGIAHRKDWIQKGSLVIVTAQHTDRVVGLVMVAMMMDIRHPQQDEKGMFIRNCPTMIAEPETIGYLLSDCEGRWWGPVHVPKFTGDLCPSMATVVNYDEGRRRYHETHKGKE